MFDPTIICARPGCGTRLSAKQVRNHNRCCSLTCAALVRQSRTYRPRVTSAAVESTAPPARAETPPPPQKPSCDVLGTEGGYTYRAGTLNGRAVVYAERGGHSVVECSLAEWPQSLAYRRCHTPRPVVTVLLAPPIGRWRVS